MYVAHVCVVLDPSVIIDVECDVFDVAEDGSVHVFLGGALVGYFPSVEYVFVTGTPDEDWEEEFPDGDDEDADEVDEDEDSNDQEDDVEEMPPASPDEVSVLVPVVTLNSGSSADNGALVSD